MSISFTDTESTVRAIRSHRPLENRTLAVDTKAMPCYKLSTRNVCYFSRVFKVWAYHNLNIVYKNPYRTEKPQTCRWGDEKGKLDNEQQALGRDGRYQDVVLEEEEFIKGQVLSANLGPPFRSTGFKTGIGFAGFGILIIYYFLIDSFSASGEAGLASSLGI